MLSVRVVKVNKEGCLPEFFNKYHAVVEYWRGGEVEYAEPIASFDELFSVLGNAFEVDVDMEGDMISKLDSSEREDLCRQLDKFTPPYEE